MSIVLIPLLLPLGTAALLLAAEHLMPRRGPDALAILASAAGTVMAALLVVRTLDAPIVYWFGGWQIVGHAAIGISFVVGPAGALIAAFSSLLFLASFVFSWGYFDQAPARYYALMLIFLGALVGFCLSGDIFNMFVFFELMSVAAFAVTAYKLEASGIEGALNFTIMTMIGSFLLLAGIGMVYARTGALNLAQIGRAVEGAPADPAVTMAFVLIMGGLMIKGAIMPFHFWLADAHAVAPSPVCVIFSGIMVPMALFGVGRIYWTVFQPSPIASNLMHDLMLYLGITSAVLGGCACLMQRHLKRMLAFSTVSHMGIMLAGLASLTASGAAGFLLYLLGHGLVKGALFMLTGVMMSRHGEVDEVALRGKGRDLPLCGIAFATSGLLLAGLPFGTMAFGHGVIDHALEDRGLWVSLLLTFGAALTGAAVLRATGRMFLGLGRNTGQESSSSTKHEQEKDRSLLLLLAPAIGFLVFALVTADLPIHDVIARAAGFYTDGHAYAALVLQGAQPGPNGADLTESGSWLGWCGIVVALVIAAFELNRDRLPKPLLRAADAPSVPVLLLINRMHTGRVGDYALWAFFGLTLFAGVIWW
ncbi:MAG TPA: proton-conducting transporter membrane subunit [Pseudolabrys sp.]|jgi:multicomponent Na+:H+ antiporter subunit D|nr:proton-conducting transporter membrane subunit [Pseudolabrys sp.]